MENRENDFGVASLDEMAKRHLSPAESHLYPDPDPYTLLGTWAGQISLQALPYLETGSNGTFNVGVESYE
jgi:hypothetical protein